MPVETWYVEEFDFWCVVRVSDDGDHALGCARGFDTEAEAVAAVDRGGQVIEIAYGPTEWPAEERE